MRVDVKFRLISDRQSLIPLMETRRLGLEPYMLDRTDMYWAEAHITDEGLSAELTYSINAMSLGGGLTGWSFTKQYGPDILDTTTVRDKLRVKWDSSQEVKEATQWANSLISAGYFDHGRAYSPNCNARECPHCGFLFERGTSHPHTYLEDWNYKGERKIIYHHKLLEKIIKEKGLVKQGVSALPDIPSLEEIGKLEPVTV